MKIKLAIEFETEIESYKELDNLVKHINNAVHDNCENIQATGDYIFVAEGEKDYDSGVLHELW